MIKCFASAQSSKSRKTITMGILNNSQHAACALNNNRNFISPWSVANLANYAVAPFYDASYKWIMALIVRSQFLLISLTAFSI